MKAKSLFVLVILRFFFSPLLAQPFPDTQWGIVKPEEWKLNRCAYDTSAAALVLFDRAEVEDRDSGVLTRRDVSYLASNNNQFIQFRTTVNFKTAQIPPEYYGDLREFYSHVIAKYNEQVVLKKI